MKIKQFDKVLQMLVAAQGAVVTVDDFKVLEGEVELYRLSTYVWNIKNKRGGDVEVIKNGRNVIGYRLTNFDKFKDFSIEKMKAEAEQEKMLKVKQNTKPAPTVIKAAMAKTEAESHSQEAEVIPEKVASSATIDPDFDSFDIDDVLPANFAE